jgi:CPA2 family monovalent cation:H+ antiporter-2
MLERERIPYMALDLDPDRVRQAAAAGHSVVYGDAARVQALRAAGLNRASAVVVTYLDTASALKLLALTHEHAPTVPVMVRTVDDQDSDKLRQAGATEVIPEAIEASLMLAGHALALVGVPMRRVIRIVQEQREQRYSLLRGYFHGADDSTASDPEQERLVTVTLPPAGRAQGRTLGDMLLPLIGVQVVSLRRASGKTVAVQDELVLAGGDTLVLSGKPDALALAEDKLVSGR